MKLIRTSQQNGSPDYQPCSNFWVLLSLAFAAAAQTPTVSSVVNEGSFTTQLCPGALAYVYGANFGTDATKVTVTVAAKPAYVISIMASQLIVQIPFEATTGATTLTITVNGVAAPPFNITLATYARRYSRKTERPAGLGDIFASTSNVVTPAAPAKPGDALTAFTGGWGPPFQPHPRTPAAASPTATAPI